MCIAPNMLQDGTVTACHKCWQCLEQAVNDWVGRNIAESKTAVASFAVTLTYGRNSANDADHERAAVLTYSDVQKYLKLLRRHGYTVRYFVTGEYGSKKGRAHWHIMLYFSGPVPEHVLEENFMEEHWPHGWSFWTLPSANAIRYNCKYIQKDMGDDARQGHLAMSKKPPLGALYFKALAYQYAEQGIAPQVLEYSFPEVRRKRKDGREEVQPFRLKDRSAELFLQHYVEAWERLQPGRKLPKSELVERFLDPEENHAATIRERMAELPMQSVQTPAQRVQLQYDLAMLDHLEWVKSKADLLEKKAREMNPVVRTGPRDIASWAEAWERQNLNEQQRQREKRKLAILQRRTERLIRAIHARTPGSAIYDPGTASP